MWNRLKSLLRRSRTDEHLLDAEKHVQELRLTLREREQTIARLKAELACERRKATANESERLRGSLEHLMVDVGTPVTQLLTQVHLIEVQGVEVGSGPVIAIVKRLMRSLEDHGLEMRGHVGEIVSFNPNFHELLSVQGREAPVSVGDPVAIRFVGVAYNETLLLKAGVEAQEA